MKLWRRSNLRGIQVGGVCHGSGVVAVVPVLDDGVKELSKHLEDTSRVTGLIPEQSSGSMNIIRLVEFVTS